MNIGYIRVSTLEQHTDRQEVAMKDLGIEKFFIEKISGKDTNRPKLKEMMDFMREGDTVYVCELSRLARSMIDMYEIVGVMQEKGVQLKSLKEEIDLSSATGKLTFGIIACLAQFERDLIRERQAEGIRASMQRGVRYGRKQKYGLNKEVADSIFQRYERKEISTEEAMELYGGGKATFYRALRKYRDGMGETRPADENNSCECRTESNNAETEPAV